MPLRRRGRTIPASCADLDFDGVGRELTRVSGNVSKTAKAFDVPTPDLRLLVYAHPELLDAAIEAEERAIDAAQAQVFAAIRGGPMTRRIRAAGLFLRATAQGRRRGFGASGGPKGVGSPRNEAGDAAPVEVQLKWLD